MLKAQVPPHSASAPTPAARDHPTLTPAPETPRNVATPLPPPTTTVHNHAHGLEYTRGNLLRRGRVDHSEFVDSGERLSAAAPPA